MTEWSGTWHPFAQSFALPTEDELREIASSIEEVGQLSACVMTPDGQGLDGRSRVAACALAGVEPRWDVFEGDPVAFIVAANAARRHLSNGQYAMAIAIGLVDAGKRTNGARPRFKRGSVVADPQVSTHAIARAGTVLDHDRALGEAVLRGDETLDAAYRKADDERKRRARLATLDGELATLVETGVLDLLEAERRADDERRLLDLSEDLVERVRGGGLSIDEAEAITRERDERVALWVAEVRAALTVLVPMAAGPIPAEFKAALSDDEYAALDVMLRGVKRQSERTKR
jgi:ParB-like chromosome segregation protein Spo0J